MSTNWGQGAEPQLNSKRRPPRAAVAREPGGKKREMRHGCNALEGEDTDLDATTIAAPPPTLSLWKVRYEICRFANAADKPDHQHCLGERRCVGCFSLVFSLFPAMMHTCAYLLASLCRDSWDKLQLRIRSLVHADEALEHNILEPVQPTNADLRR